MVDLVKRFGVSLAAERDGVWHDLGSGLRVKLARWGNPRFVRRFEELVAPHRSEIEAGSLDPEVDAAVMAKVMAETIVCDWEGVELDGKPVKWSESTAEEILKREDLRDFRADLQKRAQRVEKYRITSIKADGKNSGPASAGS